MRKQLTFRPGFHVAVTEGRFQVATMNLMPGGKEGGPDNRHRGADQWLFVVEGTGKALLGSPGGRGDSSRGLRRSRSLKAGTLLWIPKGTLHEIRNTGRTLLKTVNFYRPEAYQKNGDPLPAGRKS